MLDGAGLTDYFDKIICGDMVSHSKPHPEIFHKAAEELGASPKDCYVVEDSFNGIRAAFAAGMIPVMVPDVVMPDSEIREKLSYLFPSLKDASDFFVSLLSDTGLSVSPLKINDRAFEERKL